MPSPHVKAGLRPPPKGRLTALTRGLGTTVSAPGFRRWPLANGPAGFVPTFPTSAKNYGFRPASTPAVPPNLLPRIIHRGRLRRRFATEPDFRMRSVLVRLTGELEIRKPQLRQARGEIERSRAALARARRKRTPPSAEAEGPP